MVDTTRLEEEKEYLRSVQDQIAREREHQKKAIVDIPKNYRGRYSDVKWGDDDLVISLTKMFTERLKIIDGLEKKPYFGRFDFTMLNEIAEKFYIGKTDITKDGKSLVLDWRNPICTLYYDQSIGPVSYIAPQGKISGELTRKSQILIQDGEIESIRDVDLVSDDELLQPYLNVNADNRMKVIIASIQAEQNDIIRKPINQNLIIQGVAGSGKTSVALHRIAYLLYNAGNQYDASQFAIIGPNKYFLNYISSILPDLDTQSVKEYTFEELAEDIIGETGYTYESSNEDMHSYLKRDQKNEQTKKFKGSLQYKKCLTRFLVDYFNGCLKGGIKVGSIEAISEEYLKRGISFNTGYASNVNAFVQLTAKRIRGDWENVYHSLSRGLSEEMRLYPIGTPERSEIILQMEELKAQVKKGFSSELKKYAKPLLIRPVDLYRLFLENVDKYVQLSPEELKSFRSRTLSMLKKKTIPYEDMAAISYLSLLYNGAKGYGEYKQVVIDEAQDYSMFQFDVLRSLFKGSSFSIFGDLAQAIYSYRSLPSWEELRTQIFKDNCDILHMNKSYRTTNEITAVANMVLSKLKLEQAEPVIRTGEEVNFTALEDSDKSMFYLSRLTDYVEKGYKSVGIICKTEGETEDVAKVLQELEIPFNHIRSSDREYNAGVCLLTSYLAKGLEFDGVIINDASEDTYKSDSETDMHLLYVASTRALHGLDILHSGQLCYAFDPIKTEVKSTCPEVLIKKSNTSSEKSSKQ